MACALKKNYNQGEIINRKVLKNALLNFTK